MEACRPDSVQTVGTAQDVLFYGSDDYLEAAMNEHTRREFLYRALPGAVVAGAGLTVLQPLVSFAADPQLPPAVAPRGYTAGKFALEIDGQFAGWVQSVAGGHAISDRVALNKVAPNKVAPVETLPGVKYADITVNCGTGMSKNFYDWIKASFDKQFSRKSGAVITADYNYKEKSRLDWTGALITEVGFPALDAASKDAAKMTIKFSPETTRMQTFPAGGGAYPAGYKSGQAVQKKWLPANFRLQIAGLEQACTRVNKIEAITVRVSSAANQPLGVSKVSGVPARLQASNLVVTFPVADAKSFYDWHESFVIKGNSGPGNEKSGTLSYLTPDLKEALFTLTFRGLGIFKLTPEKVEAGGENIRRVKAEMYCKEMAFTHTPTAWA
jgi:hypothetical protein